MLAKNPSADVKTTLDIVDTNTSVNFDSHGICRRTASFMQITLRLMKSYLSLTILSIIYKIFNEINCIEHASENNNAKSIGASQCREIEIWT